MTTDDLRVSIKAVASVATAAAEQFSRSMQRFAEAMDRSVKVSEERLAQRFAEQHGSPVKTTEWTDGGNGNMLWVVTLANRRKLVGMGGGRIDALAAAELTLNEQIGHQLGQSNR